METGKKAQTPEAKLILDEMSNLMTDKQRRAVYDVTRSTSYHDTSKLPGKTHHVPGMHEGIEVFYCL